MQHTALYYNAYDDDRGPGVRNPTESNEVLRTNEY